MQMENRTIVFKSKTVTRQKESLQNNKRLFNKGYSNIDKCTLNTEASKFIKQNQ